MATTSLWAYKNEASKCIEYVMNPQKTSAENWIDLHKDQEGAVTNLRGEVEDAILVTGVGGVNASSVAKASLQFQQAKEIWGKTNGRQCYHGYQSFVEGEVSPEEAHRIGVETASRLWGDRYQVVVATHVNTHHVHNHFVINSVSIEDGYKFINSKEDYQAMRRVSDEICREHGLSVLDQNTRGSKDWRKEQANKPFVRQQICREIDAALVGCKSVTEFYKRMESIGYELKIDRRYKHPAISPPDSYDKNGKRKYYRLGNLNKYSGYSLEDIEKRIYDKSFDEEVVKREKTIHFKETIKNDASTSGRLSQKFSFKNSKNQQSWKEIKQQMIKNGTYCHSYFFYKYNKYLRILNKTNSMQQNRKYVRIAPEVKQDLKKLDLVSSATMMCARKHFTKLSEVVDYKLQLHEDIKKLSDERLKLKNRGNSEEAKEITVVINKLRSEIKTCNYILDSNLRVNQTMRTAKEHREANKETNKDKNTSSRQLGAK